MSSLPYHEPGIVTILTQASLLVLLNVVNSILDYALYCGLLGQVLLGIVWGQPAGQFLSEDAQHVIVQLGYLGLILLVYEGGLSVPVASLKANIGLSVSVALTGIAAPIALSFILMPLMDATPIQAFAAGAALCSTSLGTTFTVLSTSGLANTRLGVVLSTAAMIDDVIGLVVVQVISNLGAGSTDIEPSVVIRPLLVSVAFAFLVPLLCHYLGNMARTSLENKSFGPAIDRAYRRREVRVMLQLLLLFGMVAGGSFAGTSSLFTAYLAGAAVNWWDSSTPKTQTCRPNDPSIELEPVTRAQPSNETEPSQTEIRNRGRGDGSDPSDHAQSPQLVTYRTTATDEQLSGSVLYDSYLASPVNRILKPFFFASIGFAIPIAELFKGSLLWRGLIYTLLMLLAKAVCGPWLVRFSWTSAMSEGLVQSWLRFSTLMRHLLRRVLPASRPTSGRHNRAQGVVVRTTSRQDDPPTVARADGPAQADTGEHDATPPTAPGPEAPERPPVSLYPAAMLGSAMIARGEIGFLIASVAESNGLWSAPSLDASHESSSSSSAIFIVVTWAIFLCTFLGPIAIGLMV